MKGQRIIRFITLIALMVFMAGCSKKAGADHYIYDGGPEIVQDIPQTIAGNGEDGCRFVSNGVRYTVPGDFDVKIDDITGDINIDDKDLDFNLVMVVRDGSYEESLEDKEWLMASAKQQDVTILKEITEYESSGKSYAYFTFEYNDHSSTNTVIYTKATDDKRIGINMIINADMSEEEAIDKINSFLKTAEAVDLEDTMSFELPSAWGSGYDETAYGHEDMYVPDEKTARKLLREMGEELRSGYEQDEVREIESYLEKTYGMEAVNLQDMDPKLAKCVKDACDYMFKTYPILNGYLTNITVRDEVSDSGSAIALYETNTWIMNPDADRLYPLVIRKQILLRARDFENSRRIENLVRMNVRDGFWTEGTDVTAVIVHELGHALVSCIISNDYGLGNSVFIDESKGDAYTRCNTQLLADDQEFVKGLCERAYEKYKKEKGMDVSYEEFCGEISGYAQGTQYDGGISFDETVAEAISNAYVHGKDCALPARLILDETDRAIKGLNK